MTTAGSVCAVINWIVLLNSSSSCSYVVQYLSFHSPSTRYGNAYVLGTSVKCICSSSVSACLNHSNLCLLVSFAFDCTIKLTTNLASLLPSPLIDIVPGLSECSSIFPSRL